MAEEEKRLASEEFVERKIQTLLEKNFMSIDPATGQFMIPAAKVDGVQRYGRLAIVMLDGAMTLQLDGKLYTKNPDDTYTEAL